VLIIHICHHLYSGQYQYTVLIFSLVDKICFLIAVLNLHGELIPYLARSTPSSHHSSLFFVAFDINSSLEKATSLLFLITLLGHLNDQIFLVPSLLDLWLI
jgi:hypothetical protein